jgi:hypothetical protein
VLSRRSRVVLGCKSLVKSSCQMRIVKAYVKRVSEEDEPVGRR